MPLVETIETDAAAILLWRIAESEDELLAAVRLTAGEALCFSGLSHGRRRREWLAARTVIKNFLGAGTEVEYDADGAPRLVGGRRSISISHAGGYVAVMFARARCGVDIEEAGRDFGRVAPRYILEAEEAAFGGIDRYKALIWCAKEAVYKYYGKPGIPFREGIEIVAIDPAASSMEAVADGCEKIRLGYRFIGPLAVAYTVASF